MQVSLPFDSPLVCNGERLAQDKPFDSPADPVHSNPTNRPEPRDSAAPVPFTRRPPVFVRQPRAKRYLLRVTPDGTVRVTIPRWGSKREAAAFAESLHQSCASLAARDVLGPRSPRIGAAVGASLVPLARASRVDVLQGASIGIGRRLRSSGDRP